MFVHAVAPPVEYVPAAHPYRQHDVAAVSGLKYPAGMLVHSVAPLVEKVPALHVE